MSVPYECLSWKDETSKMLSWLQENPEAPQILIHLREDENHVSLRDASEILSI